MNLPDPATHRQSYNCPHCNHEFVDEWEALDLGVHEIRCEECGTAYSINVVDDE